MCYNIKKKMPYGLRKSPNKKLYWVVNKETGHKFSKSPIPLERAQRQRRAIYASENGYSLQRKKKSSPKKKSSSKKSSPKKKSPRRHK